MKRTSLMGLIKDSFYPEHWFCRGIIFTIVVLLQFFTFNHLLAQTGSFSLSTNSALEVGSNYALSYTVSDFGSNVKITQVRWTVDIFSTNGQQVPGDINGISNNWLYDEDLSQSPLTPNENNTVSISFTIGDDAIDAGMVGVVL